MKNIRSIINEAMEKGYDVTITDGNYYMDRKPCGGWYVCGEYGWFSTEEEVDEMVMVEYHYDDNDKMAFITVENTGW